MDYVIGGELFSLIKLNRRMPEEMARFYAGEVGAFRTRACLLV